MKSIRIFYTMDNNDGEVESSIELFVSDRVAGVLFDNNDPMKMMKDMTVKNIEELLTKICSLQDYNFSKINSIKAV